MPVDVQFNADENIIVAIWTNPVSHSDFAEAFKVAKSAYAEAKSPVHTIYEASKLTSLPANAISIYLRDANSPLRNKLAGCFVVVASNGFIRSIVETAGRVARGTKVYVATSVEDAKAIIARESAKQK